MTEAPSARRRGVLGAIALAAVGGLLAVTHPWARRPPTPPAAATMTLRPRPFATTISAVGVLAPGDSAAVVAPFDGMVASRRFDYGGRVEAGQVLLTLATDDLQAKRREAMAAYLKATQARGELDHWDEGAEVSRARRQLRLAQQDLDHLERELQETKGLLDKGLVARTEYEGLLHQRETQAAALSAAQDDLLQAQKRGGPTSRAVADLDLQGARARVAAFDVDLRGASVTAPAAGVLVRPPPGRSGPEPEVFAGERVSRGQLIGLIARADDLAVVIKLDEADADKVAVGQPAEVSGPGFADLTVTGHVASVAGEAAAADGGGGASFAAVVRLDPLPADAARRLRIGMTATATIRTYAAAAALVVPPTAVIGAAPVGAVRVRDVRSGQVRMARVRIGAVAPDGVEILSGLRAGDQVVLPAAGTEGGR